MEDIICIHKTYNSQTADLLKARLESAGIPCYLRSDNAGGSLPYLTALNGIGIMVRAEDEEEAAEILDLVIRERGTNNEDCVEVKSDKVSLFLILIIFFILPLLLLLQSMIFSPSVPYYKGIH